MPTTCDHALVVIARLPAMGANRGSAAGAAGRGCASFHTLLRCLTPTADAASPPAGAGRGRAAPKPMRLTASHRFPFLRCGLTTTAAPLSWLRRRPFFAMPWLRAAGLLNSSPFARAWNRFLTPPVERELLRAACTRAPLVLLTNVRACSPANRGGIAAHADAAAARNIFLCVCGSLLCECRVRMSATSGRRLCASAVRGGRAILSPRAALVARSESTSSNLTTKADMYNCCLRGARLKQKSSHRSTVRRGRWP